MSTASKDAKNSNVAKTVYPKGSVGKRDQPSKVQEPPKVTVKQVA